MQKFSILAVIGARPQFIKHAALQYASKGFDDQIKLETVHTGQHYDYEMSQLFFEELELLKPSYHFDLHEDQKSKTQIILISKLIQLFEKVDPDLILAYGDTYTTLVSALSCQLTNIPFAHIEAGMRSYNREMPEEFNRIVADHAAQLRFCVSNASIENLEKENLYKENHLVGDLMKDSFELTRKTSKIGDKPLPGKYYYATLHRPYNVDSNKRLLEILRSLNKLNKMVHFSLHPRTKKNMDKFRINSNDFPNISFVKPVSFTMNLQFMNHAEAILTDSGGMQKEAYWLKKKCITIRSETEWIETLENGWNTLVFEDLTKIPGILAEVPGKYDDGLYGDGNAATKILEIILNYQKKEN